MTPCSRPFNLPRVGYSINRAKAGCSLAAQWLVVADMDAMPEYATSFLLDHMKVPWAVAFQHDPSSKVGVAQKNAGIDAVKDGFLVFLDDDTVMHEMFLKLFEHVLSENPRKKAFVFGQMRLDAMGYLEAKPENVKPCKIDSGQVVLHRSIIADLRIDMADLGFEDYVFIKKIYDRHKAEFVFVNRTLSYYNYLRPTGVRGECD